MTASKEVPSSVDAVRRRADDASRRASRADEAADRHELLARRDPVSMRSFHLSMARTYRQIASRQQMSATLQAAYADRLTRWYTETPGRGEYGPFRPRFMATVAETSGGDSAALTLRARGRLNAVTAASDATASAAQSFEFELNEGPTSDAMRTRRLVSAVDHTIAEHWPNYGHDLTELGVRAVASVPLVAAAECLGALTVYGSPPMCAAPGVERLRSVASELTRSVLLAPESTAIGEDGLPYFPAVEESDGWAVVHQAAGMLAARNECTVSDAFALLQAHAFAENTGISSVAARVVRRELVLPQD
ncbi:GAF and ANTAR domain-containing protein [Flindersiella endophytica]